MLKDVGIEFTKPIVIHYDNTSTISMSKNPVLHSKTKHVSIKYNVLRQKVVEKEIRLEYVHTNEKIVDILTKPFPKGMFEYLHGILGVIPLPTSVQMTQRVHQSSGIEHYCISRLTVDASYMREQL